MAERIEQEVAITGVEEAEAKLRRLGETAAEAFKKIEDSAKSSGTKGLGEAEKAAEGAAEGLEKVAEAAEEIPGPAGKAAKALNTAAAAGKAVGVAIVAIAGAAATAVGGMILLARGAAETASALRDMSIQAGTTVESFQQLAFAAQQSGARAQDFVLAASAIADAAQEASVAGEFSSRAFERLGIRLVGAGGQVRDTAAVLGDLADVIQRANSPSEQLSIAIETLGRRIGPRLVQALRQGREGLQEFADDLARLGGPLTAAEVDVGENLADAFNRLSTAVELFRTRIGLAFAPALTRIINAIADAVGRIAIAFQPTIEAIGDFVDNGLTALIDGFNSLVEVVGSSEGFRGFLDLLRAIGSFISEILIPVITGLAQTIGFLVSSILALRDAIKETFGIDLLALPFATALQTVPVSIDTLGRAMSALGFIIDQITAGLLFLGDAFSAVTSFVANLAAELGLLSGQAFTIDWSILVQDAQAAFDFILQGAQFLVQGLAGFFFGIVGLLSQVWSQVSAQANAAWQAIRSAASTAFNAIISLFSSGTLSSVWNSIKSAAESAFNTIRSIGTSAVAAVTDAIDDLIATVKAAVQEVIRLASELASLAGFSAGGLAFAGGGRVSGPGTATSDSIPARLSAGEFIIQAKAVRKYGAALFYMLNSMRLPARDMVSLFRGMAGFRHGGLVPDLSVPRFTVPLRMAEGGEVSSRGDMRPLTLQLFGKEFAGLLAPSDVAAQLERFAVTQKVKSAGRKPSWV